VLAREQLPERSADLGARWLGALENAVAHQDVQVELRGSGLMSGVDLGRRPGAASELQLALLQRGYITTTGGGRRETLVLTPPLTIDEDLLFGFASVLGETMADLAAG
jgi:4-aminobutyrate aminotransferase-like enzyme